MHNRDHWLVGVHAVKTALQDGNAQVIELWVAHDNRGARIEELANAAKAGGIPIQRVDKATLDDVAGRSAHQGVAARFRPSRPTSLPDLVSAVEEAGDHALVLLLDGVQDPGNLGACLRAAECAGVTGVVIPKHRAVGVTATVHKASAGAATRLRIVEVANLVQAMERLQSAGLWLVGAAAESAQSLYELDLTGALGIVMGGEEKGLRRLVRERCDYLAAIPMMGRTASLNVSVATGICLFEANRQRAFG